MDPKKRTIPVTETAAQKKPKIESEGALSLPISSTTSEADADQTSPKSKQRILKVIPPKDPLADPSKATAAIVLKGTSAGTSPELKKITIVGPASPESKKAGHKSPEAKKTVLIVEEGEPKKKDSPKRVLVEPSKIEVDAPVPSSPKKVKVIETKPNSPKKDEPSMDVDTAEEASEAPLEKPADKPKAKKVLDETKVAKVLEQMQFNLERNEILNLIKAAQANNQNESIVINDKRLSISDHPNYNVYLGHVVYTGAKSKTPHFNRAVDLELFLCPKFTAKDHYATIQVRIPAEFLSYRGNIAVRKSALWGTDVYTDDSDVVAMIIHSGHYRPVDAPDLNNENQKESPTKELHDKRQVSEVNLESEISTKVLPVIAEADLVHSSSTILVPDHDLHVTLRILPKLIKYTGSTRYGLDSKGWGAHDGESVKVVKVERVERGSVRKAVKKSVSKKWAEIARSSKKCMSLMFFSDGTPCFKYTPEAMNAWPPHLKGALKENADLSDIAELSLTTLQDMKDLPFWRLQLLNHPLLLELNDGKKISAQMVDDSVEIRDDHQSEVFKPEELVWEADGFSVKSKTYNVVRFCWN